ncbi:MAG: zinc-binding dehydrogenase, partial [Nitrososphaerota archaeon]|nr:zinc-binding dehydrogenase [Nitrososphaerota archaeon]
ASTEKLSFEEASLAEPLGCCIRGLDHAGVFSKRLSNVIVVGSGPIGLLHMELINSILPDTKICAVDVLGSRLDFAEKNEGAIPIDANKSSNGSFSVDALKHTDGLGFDMVLVATGSKSAFAEGMKCVRKSGTLLLFGAPHKGATHDLDLAELFLSEHTITSSYSTTEKELSKAIQLLEENKINVRKFVTSKFPLAKIDEAMRVAREQDQIKTIVIG